MTVRRESSAARLSGSLALGAALAFGCADDARWERARSEYCQAADSLAQEADRRITAVAESIRGGDERSCARAGDELRVLGAKIDGFTTTAHVLARARPDAQSVEQAGFHLDFGAGALARHDAGVCLNGDTTKAAQQIVDIKASVADQFKRGLAACEAVGWRPIRADEPAK